MRFVLWMLRVLGVCGVGMFMSSAADISRGIRKHKPELVLLGLLGVFAGFMCAGMATRCLFLL